MLENNIGGIQVSGDKLQVSGRGPESRSMDKILVRKKALWKFPGDPVIKAQRFHCNSPRFNH